MVYIGVVTNIGYGASLWQLCIDAIKLALAPLFVAASECEGGD
jgi:hypothetical protein